MKAPEKFTTDAVLWQHAAHRILNQSFRVFSKDHVGRVLPLTTIVSRVRKNYPVRKLLACHFHFLRVDDHNMVSTINIGSIARLVLAANDFCNLACNTAQNLVFGIYQNPVFLGVCLV